MRTHRAVSVLLSAVIGLGLTGLAFADNGDRTSQLCGLQSGTRNAATTGGVGGKYITASGTLKILIVFASFPNDETPHPYWPAHNPPLYMEQFLDPDTVTKSQGPFNVTNYFHQMSLGQFHVVGKAVWVEGPYSDSEYVNGAYGRATGSVLIERVDPIVDFAEFDNWTNEGPYKNINVRDGIVDMIIVVWRTNIFGVLGEASLGYRKGYVMDGVRIETGFPERYDYPVGSGVMCEYPYGDTPSRVMQTMVHEFGHWLLGGPHPYNSMKLSDKHQFWGILCAGQRISSCANSYEREKLGWLTVPEIQPDLDIPLPDFLSTGTAFKYNPPSGDPLEYFYIENHQMLSPFDDVTQNPDDRGIWILHQMGPYGELDNLRIRPSDGNWNWQNPGVTTACFSQGLPMFARGVPMVLTGQSHRDQIPTGSSLVNWMYAYRDPSGQVNCGSFLGGQLFRGSFNANSTRVFSPYSNPASTTWDNQPTSFSMEVVNDMNGVVTIRCNSNPLDTAPAQRYVGPDPSVHGSNPGPIALAWGPQWPEGQPIETDVNWSELQRKIGNSGSWNAVYQGPATTWADGSLTYDTNGTVPVFFRVRVRDIQSRYSSWSNSFFTRAISASGADNQAKGEMPDHFALGQNFPNPFNPMTTIEYSIPVGTYSSTSLRVYDLLGREVAVLVNEKKSPGTYSVRFDAGGLPSGVYLYRLTAGRYVGTRKMLLIR